MDAISYCFMLLSILNYLSNYFKVITGSDNFLIPQNICDCKRTEQKLKVKHGMITLAPTTSVLTLTCHDIFIV